MNSATEEEAKWLRSFRRVMRKQPESVKLMIARWGSSISVVRAYDDDPPYCARRDGLVIGTVQSDREIVTLD